MASNIIAGFFYQNFFNNLISEKDPEVVKSNNQYATIESLQKYTNYTVWVVAYTKVGDGVKTKPFYCRTNEDGK